MKKVGIMQPYFLPYLGYFQLINSVDEFVIYDNIEYTKKGWINRNRYLCNGSDKYMTLQLKKASDYEHVCNRELSPEFDRKKLLRQLSDAYRKAPYYNQVFPLLEEIIMCEENNLFKYIYHSVCLVCKYLGIDTIITISSSLDCDHTLKGEEKVLAICASCDAKVYINAIGGMELYHNAAFEEKDMQLFFIKNGLEEYKQFDNEFIPALSILDVMMFNSKDDLNRMINDYQLIKGDL